MKNNFWLAFLVLVMLCGCTMGYRNVGKSKKWRDIGGELKIGMTRQAEILERLGPPSLVDMRSMKGRTIYYYWMEKLNNKSLYLGVYNYWRVDIRYDRAMFIFNKDGVLEYYGISRDATGRDED